MTSHALFLFAPKFCEFGIDVAKAWAGMRSEPVRVHGFCTGPSRVRERVEAGLGDLAGRLDELPPLEREWVGARPDATARAAFERRYPAGTLGDTVTSDRRIGRGYVVNGLTRPDLIADAALGDPERVPEAYVIALYAFIEDRFDRIRPSFVFCYAVAGAPAYALSIVCARRKIPFLQLAPARLGARYIIDTDARGLLRPTAERFRAGGAPSAKALNDARAFIATFRSQPQPPEYMATVERRRATMHTYSRAASLWRGSAIRAFGAWLTGSEEKRQKSRRGFYEARMIMLQKRAEVAERARRTDLPGRFVYYPLHVSPEASTMVLAPRYSDQIPVIEALSKALPPGMSLVVKEHVPMVGLRPEAFYERIAAMPGVRLVSPFLQGVALVQEAELVAVITGTAAWEAFLLGRPSISLAEMQFHCVPGAGVVVEDLSLLPQVVRAAGDLAPVPDSQIERYVASLFEESFDLPGYLLWGKYTDANSDERASVSRIIATHLQARLTAAVRFNSDR